MLSYLENQYDVKPIIYATQKSYDFDDYDIWIRKVITSPKLADNKFRFWQYTNRARLLPYRTYYFLYYFKVLNHHKKR